MSGMFYKARGFYVEDPASVWYRGWFENCTDPLFSDCIRMTASCKEEFRGAISLDHELNHYVQDVLLSSCIGRSQMEDWLFGAARSLLKNNKPRIPLCIDENRAYNKNLLLSADESNTLELFYKVYDIYKQLYMDRYKIPDNAELSFLRKIIPDGVEASLSFRDLLESYAYHKSYWDFFRNNTSGKGAEILHEIVKEDGVYLLDDDKFVRRKLNINKQYQLPHYLILFGLGFNKDSIREYLKNSVPHGYSPNSKAELMHSTMRCVMETALNIPGDSYVVSKMLSGEYNIEVFSPVHRFYAILQLLHTNNGCPDAIKGESYFKTFYDWVAEKLGWPNVTTLNASMNQCLCERLNRGGEVITGYQIRAFDYKVSNWSAACQYPPMQFLLLLNVPVLTVSPHGASVKSFVGGMACDSGTLVSVYNRFFCGEVQKFQPVAESDETKEKIRKTLENGRHALYEMVRRLMAREVTMTYLRTGKYQCPFSENGCPHSSAECRSFSDFGMVTAKCDMIIFRKENKSLIVPQGFGNAPDCMLYNYLLDYGCDPNRIGGGNG